MDLVINLEYKPSIPLFRRLSDALRKAIIEGRLKPGEAMPSVRDIADTTKISRATILKSFDDLRGQGYLVSASGAGTYVRDPLPHDLDTIYDRASEPAKPETEKPISFSKYGRRVLANSDAHTRRSEQLEQIHYCGPPLEYTPLKQWRQLLLRHCRLRDVAKLAHEDEPLGYGPLRDALSAYLHRARGIKHAPEQMVVFAGQQLKLEIPARLLVDEGDLVALEEPGFPDARLCFGAHGAQFVSVPVDSEGIDVSYLRAQTRKIKCVYVTPSHQDPTCVVMSLDRRRELLEWADRSGALIIEDDYDSEYRYGADPLPSLQGMCRRDNVIYISSLWKVLYPMVRMGFLVIPRQLLKPVLLAKLQTERNLPLLEQFALTDFINEGHLERHIRRTRNLYARRRHSLILALTRHMLYNLELAPESAGMHVLVKVETNLPEREVIERANASGLFLSSTGLCYSASTVTKEFLLPFAHLDEDTVDEKISAWNELLTK